MFLDGGGLPGTQDAVQEPTAFLPNPQAQAAAAPGAQPEEGTAFIAPPSQYGLAHARPGAPAPQRPPSVATSAPPRAVPTPPPGQAPGAQFPMANEPSMTRFVVQERSPVRTVAMFVAGLVLALAAAGAAAYFILNDSADDTQASE